MWSSTLQNVPNMLQPSGTPPILQTSFKILFETFIMEESNAICTVEELAIRYIIL